jgi:RHS repeat-associated protein
MLWDGQAYLGYANGSNVFQMLYAQEPMIYGGLLLERNVALGGNPVFFVYDALGSTVNTWHSGSSGGGNFYKAFGEILPGSASSGSPFLWIGRWGYYYDASTGTVHVRRRDENPVTGQWISEDPVGLGPDVNPRRYAWNNSINAVDPSGLFIERSTEGKFTIGISRDMNSADALNSDVEVTYNVTVYDKIIYCKIKLDVYARTMERNFLWWGIPGLLNGQEKWHPDVPKPGQLIGTWPEASNGPYWTDRPGKTMYKGLNISMWQDFQGRAMGLSKCDCKWHEISRTEWGHSAKLVNGKYVVKRWPPPK